MSIASMPAVFDSSLLIAELRNRKKEKVLGELATLGERCGVVTDASLLRDTLVLRERVATTATGKGTAIPHARSIAVSEPRLLVGRSSKGIDWDAPDEEPVHLVLLAILPSEVTRDVQLDFLTQVAGVVRLQRNRQKLLEAESAETMVALVQELLA